MKVIAQTNNTYLIEATKAEVSQIVLAVTGSEPSEIKIGQKLPAIDYSSTITKVQQLGKEYNFRQLKSYIDNFVGHYEKLKEAVDSASEIEI